MTATVRTAASRLERRESLRLALFAVPALIFMAGVFAVPLAIILRQSLTGQGGGLSWAPFARIFEHAMYARVAWSTLQIGLLATGFALLLAYPLAYFLARQPPRRRALLTTVVLVPFWTSAMVKSFAFVVILGHSGIINSLLARLGIAPLALLFNRVGVIVGMSHYLVCFTMFPILTNLMSQPPELRRAAAMMGAGPWRIFWRVTLPLSLPGVLAGVLLVFILSLGFYVVPALLGGLQDMMLSNLVDFYASESIDWPMASALSVVLTCAAAVAALGLLLIPGGGGVLGEEGRR